METDSTAICLKVKPGKEQNEEHPSTQEDVLWGYSNSEWVSLSSEECCVKINPPGSLSSGESHDTDSLHRGKPPAMKFTLTSHDHEHSP